MCTEAIYREVLKLWNTGRFFFSMPLPAHSGPRPLIQFRNHFSQTVGLLGRVISSSQGRYLNTGQHKHRINTYTYQTSMPWVGFEPTIPASERAKAFHALDRAATVTGETLYAVLNNYIANSNCGTVKYVTISQQWGALPYRHKRCGIEISWIGRLNYASLLL
jgi:hypothetical protein